MGLLMDPEQNVGARLIQEVASKSDSKAVGGATTSTIMTQAIIKFAPSPPISTPSP